MEDVTIVLRARSDKIDGFLIVTNVIVFRVTDFSTTSLVVITRSLSEDRVPINKVLVQLEVEKLAI